MFVEVAMVRLQQLLRMGSKSASVVGFSILRNTKVPLCPVLYCPHPYYILLHLLINLRHSIPSLRPKDSDIIGQLIRNCMINSSGEEMEGA